MELQLFGSELLCILLFAGLIGILLFDVFGPSEKSGKENPLDLLQRNYASAKISTDAYEERKKVLEWDKKK